MDLLFSKINNDLLMIIEDWAGKSKLSVYEKCENRIIYSKKFSLGGKAWLSVENNGGKARLEAWQAPSGLSPDRKGNFWLGWKTPVP